MIGLLQRVSEARVDVDGKTIGAIGIGLMVLVCAERGDTVTEAERLLKRLLGYRVFADATGKMNLSLRDVAGGVAPRSPCAPAGGDGERARTPLHAEPPPRRSRRGFSL